MTDLAAIRERHVMVTLPKGDSRERTRWQGCDFDEQPWPCDAAQLHALLAATPSVEPRGLAGALAILDVIDGIVDDTHPEGDGCPLCAALDELRDILGGTTR